MVIRTVGLVLQVGIIANGIGSVNRRKAKLSIEHNHSIKHDRTILVHDDPIIQVMPNAC